MTTVRAFVWIEQEIAIVAMIQQLVRNNRDEPPVAAYIHQSIKMEGIRTLLHLNPSPFEGIPSSPENNRSFLNYALTPTLNPVQ